MLLHAGETRVDVVAGVLGVDDGVIGPEGLDVTAVAVDGLRKLALVQGW